MRKYKQLNNILCAILAITCLGVFGCSGTNAQTTAASLSVTTTLHPNIGILSPGERASLTLTLKRPVVTSADEVNIVIRDYANAQVMAKNIIVPAGAANPFTQEIDVKELPAGYYAVSATLKSSGAVLAAIGTRPVGISTFGIMPSIQALPLSTPDESRFGIQGTAMLVGGDPYEPFLGLLGAHWVIDRQQWARMEPNYPGQFTGALDDTFHYEALDHLSVIADCSNAPVWAFNPGKSKEKFGGDQVPDKLDDYATFLTKMAARQAALRANGSLLQQQGYYEVTWEPDAHFKASDADMVRLYQAAYPALHKGDPKAVVMGPAYGILPASIPHLQKLFQLGLGKYLDGIATHTYHGRGPDNLPGDQMGAPEDFEIIPSMRALREMTKKYLAPGAKIYQTELGMGYPKNAVITADLLRLQADYSIRQHIIVLGEGADVDYFFYTADDSMNGFGLTFNLHFPVRIYASDMVSPKPLMMASAALTRILEGTKAIGSVNLGVPGAYAYAFQRGDKVVLAAWAHPKPVNVTLKINAPRVTLVNMMGDTREQPISQGALTLNLGQDPVYLMDIPASAMNIQP